MKLAFLAVLLFTIPVLYANPAKADVRDLVNRWWAEFRRPKCLWCRVTVRRGNVCQSEECRKLELDSKAW
jgi:hypothetical protein